MSIPGQNSSYIKERFEIEIQNRYNDTDNFILIYAFGIKDAVLLKENNEYSNIFKNNIKYIVESSKKYTEQIYFIGLIEPDYLKRKEYNKDCVNEINNTVKDLCNENKINYIEISNLINNEELVDGLHPNDIGHEKISAIIFNKLNK